MPSWYGALIQKMLPLVLQRVDSTTSETVTHILATADSTAVSENFFVINCLKQYTELQSGKRQGRQCVYMLV